MSKGILAFLVLFQAFLLSQCRPPSNNATVSGEGDANAIVHDKYSTQIQITLVTGVVSYNVNAENYEFPFQTRKLYDQHERDLVVKLKVCLDGLTETTGEETLKNLPHWRIAIFGGKDFKNKGLKRFKLADNPLDPPPTPTDSDKQTIINTLTDSLKRAHESSIENGGKCFELFESVKPSRIPPPEDNSNPIVGDSYNSTKCPLGEFSSPIQDPTCSCQNFNYTKTIINAGYQGSTMSYTLKCVPECNPNIRYNDLTTMKKFCKCEYEDNELERSETGMVYCRPQPQGAPPPSNDDGNGDDNNPPPPPPPPPPTTGGDGAPPSQCSGDQINLSDAINGDGNCTKALAQSGNMAARCQDNAGTKYVCSYLNDGNQLFWKGCGSTCP
ncbi:MAG: hypothetical protein KBD78_12915 [Oligoflexales bacterium]|nr:hypothetical protein [Oligoflexales bacterium]